MPVFMKPVVLLACLAVLLPTSGLAQTDACDDLSGVDFGICLSILGWGKIGGSCQQITGCSSPVPLFVTQQACEEGCDLQPTCDDLDAIDFGFCLGILGAGMISGECTLITGCSSPVPLFADIVECQAACTEVDAEVTNWSSLKARYE
ncbi:hypothetical protein DRQ32_05450 [bacterium]|nr:MAG: hypothetical protein DRQ32_05450 [bacterium]